MHSFIGKFLCLQIYVYRVLSTFVCLQFHEYRIYEKLCVHSFLCEVVYVKFYMHSILGIFVCLQFCVKLLTYCVICSAVYTQLMFMYQARESSLVPAGFLKAQFEMILWHKLFFRSKYFFKIFCRVLISCWKASLPTILLCVKYLSY